MLVGILLRDPARDFGVEFESLNSASSPASATVITSVTKTIAQFVLHVMYGFGSRKTKTWSIKLIELHVSGKYLTIDFLFFVALLYVAVCFCSEFFSSY